MHSRIIKHTSIRFGDLLLPVGPLYRASEEHLEAREGLLAQLGQYQAVVAYQSAARGGLTVLLDEQIPLVLVDPDAMGDVTIVDLDDSEAATARAGEAAILDDLLKSLDSSALDALIREASTDSPAVAALLDALAQAHGIVPPGETVDPADLWKGMPEFEQEDLSAYQSIHVHFKSKEDVMAFSRLVNQTLTDKTRAIWHPQSEKIDMVSEVWANES